MNNLRAYSKRGYFETCECVFFCVDRIRTRISLFTDECGRGCAVVGALSLNSHLREIIMYENVGNVGGVRAHTLVSNTRTQGTLIVTLCRFHHLNPTFTE